MTILDRFHCIPAVYMCKLHTLFCIHVPHNCGCPGPTCKHGLQILTPVEELFRHCHSGIISAEQVHTLQWLPNCTDCDLMVLDLTATMTFYQTSLYTSGATAMYNVYRTTQTWWYISHIQSPYKICINNEYIEWYKTSTLVCTNIIKFILLPSFISFNQHFLNLLLLSVSLCAGLTHGLQQSSPGPRLSSCLFLVVEPFTKHLDAAVVVVAMVTLNIVEE